MPDTSAIIEYINICIYVFSGLLGLLVGSFLNVVIYRVPRGESLAFPGSHCPNCNTPIKWYDNIPVISYCILLRGKCRNCKQHISFRYTIVEVLNMLLWLGCAWAFRSVGTADKFWVSFIYMGAAMVTCSVLLCVTFIDIEHMIIPDRFHIILVAMGVVAIIAGLVLKVPGAEFMPTEEVAGVAYNPRVITVLERLIGAVGAGVLFLGIYFIAPLVFKREAMGFGDVKLVAAAGLMLGWKNMVLVVLLGAVLACVVLLGIKIVRKDEQYTEYPFAPFLAVAMIAALLVGNYATDWYAGLFEF